MRSVPPSDELARVLHDIGRLGLDARRTLMARRQEAADAQVQLFELEMAAAKLTLTLRRAQRPKFQIPAEVAELRAQIKAERESEEVPCES